MTNKPQSGTQDRNDNRPNVRATALRVSASCDAGNIEAQSGFVSLQFPPIGDCGGHQSSVKPQRYDWDRASACAASARPLPAQQLNSHKARAEQIESEFESKRGIAG